MEGMETRTVSPPLAWPRCARPGTGGAPVPREADRLPRSLWLWRVAAVALCGLHAWVARHAINPDGISYLDLADAWRRGAWAEAVNAYWSPLYSWLIAGTLAVFRPAPGWECAAVHGLNFVLFLAALAAFEWLLHEGLLRQRGLRAESDRGEGFLPEWALAGFAYAAFIWISRQLVTVSYVTPDMAVAALVYAAAALLLRQRRVGPRPGSAAVLGLVLGLAYLAKAIMFPLAFVFLAASALVAGSWRRAWRPLVPALLAFAVTAGPYVAALSQARGRLTFGDSGRLNYLWYVNGIPRPHFTGDPAAGLQPRHPPRQLGDRPALYEFAAGTGSYPLWFDPTRWYEGVPVRLDAGKQLAALGRTAREYADLFLGLLLPFTLALALLCGFAWWGRGVRWRALAGEYPLLLPALACLGLYWLVGHVEGRLIGPFLVLLILAMLLVVRPAAARVAAVVMVSRVLLLGLGALLVVNWVYDGRNAVAAMQRGRDEGHPDEAVVRQLRRQGVDAGAAVGSIGFTFDAYWARLGGYRVVAEIGAGQAPHFWAADPDTRRQVLERFRQAGARALVAENVPEGSAGWEPLAGTRWSVRPLP
jgi:hypothetical protein